MRRATVCVLPAALLAAGCQVGYEPEPRERRTESRSIDIGRAETVNAVVEMPAGTLRIGGGASKLMDGEFTYSSSDMEPEVTYSETGFRGRLRVGIAPGRHAMSDSHWGVRLNREVPMELEVHLGAGDGELKLAGLSLRNLDIEMGVGKMEVDMTGQPWKRNCDVKVRGGVGELKIRVPREVGVVAEAKGGIGDIDVHGLHRDGNRWVNDAYGEAPVTIRLDVKGGIGRIEISSEG